MKIRFLLYESSGGGGGGWVAEDLVCTRTFWTGARHRGDSFFSPDLRRCSMNTYNSIDLAQHTTAVIDDAATDTCLLPPRYNRIELEEEGGKKEGTYHSRRLRSAHKSNRFFLYLLLRRIICETSKKKEIIQ